MDNLRKVTELQTAGPDIVNFLKISMIINFTGCLQCKFYNGLNKKKSFSCNS